ncbi:ubiquitin-protein ligase ASR1 LALA0_S03e05358g [Lachancea lanzarotensis]|uniref:LALA0S03e05358g1_1 n=1 Tax=Lachancea lanzarotensis TaxID=1245769 RepID=A0A0C7N0V3_9SACH|nr:uncharacterized protein LALA0_S03e05358g [Lachancea lanzarotensis]CEP61549.1 LALA0S03e05358g1_1 [Lachancea lanzarotensis]
MSRDECPICLEQLDETRACLVECGHAYHFECIRKWHQQSQDLKCPTCRRESRYLKQIVSNVVVDIEKYFSANRVISEVVEGLSGLTLGSEEDRRQSWTLRSMECGICGALNSDIDHHCTVCHTAFHERCLRILQVEVGDFCSGLFCCNCHQAFLNSGQDISVRGETIQALVLPHARTQVALQAASSRNRSELDESWMLLSQLRTEVQVQAIADHKRSIQNHVRRALHSHYEEVSSGCKAIDKKQFTDINKTVSRRLYRMSGYRYCPHAINYDDEAQVLIREELSRLCTGT